MRPKYSLFPCFWRESLSIFPLRTLFSIVKIGEKVLTLQTKSTNINYITMCPRSRKSNKKSKSITRNTTCCDLFDFNEIEFCCDNCKPKVDVLSFKRKAKKQSSKDKHFSNKCRQPSTASHASSTSKASRHLKVCECLSVESSVATEDERKCSKKRHGSLSSLSKVDSS